MVESTRPYSKNNLEISLALKIRSCGIHNFRQDHGPVNYDAIADHTLAIVGASCCG